MNRPLLRAVAAITLAQVGLVGAFGTGLHALFGCEHEPQGGCTAACCKVTAEASSRSDCEDCVFCLRAADKQAASNDFRIASVTSAGCDGCAVCDLLAQYHCVTPFELESLAIVVTPCESAIQRQNAVVAATIRLALSRGPPAV